ncbi:unnamed protein product [Rangifer tarandus platyrhynchus]|uniref:Uncharacterized protein n=1 Tax=Rangifer tarandus platyrhynchus TaxID=3082113 RepID=A0AC59ZAP3_RANTA
MPLVHLWSLLSFLSSSSDPAPSHRGTPKVPIPHHSTWDKFCPGPKAAPFPVDSPRITCRSWSSQLPAPMHCSRFICTGVPLQLCFLTPELLPLLPQVPDLGDNACRGGGGDTHTHTHPPTKLLRQVGDARCGLRQVHPSQPGEARVKIKVR